MAALIPATADARHTTLASTADAANALLKARHSETTRRVYAADALRFRDWCVSSHLCPLPAEPQSVALFVASEIQRGINPRTISRRLAAIRHLHLEAGLLDPTAAEVVRAVLSGARRTVGCAPRQAAPATAGAIEKMLGTCDDSLQGRRDRLLLSLGFGGAFRRSELVALDVADIEVVEHGLRVLVRRSKTDQTAQGQHVPVADGPRTRVKAALEAWLTAAGITEGPIFRPVSKGGKVLCSRLSDRSVAIVVKHRAALAGLDPAKFSGHSLRRGWITSAAEAGADVLRIMDVSRHRRVETVRGYVQRANEFVGHAGMAFS